MRWVLIVTLIAVSGCLSDDLIACGDRSCPTGEVCSPAGDACVQPDQIDACRGRSDGMPCTPSTSAPGTCEGGVCVQVCGDGVVELGEQCDDGNQNPADGCDACTLTTWVATAAIGGTAGTISTALDLPMAIAIDRAGNVYIADTGNNRVRRVDAPTGAITTIAGNGIAGYGGDGDIATNAELDQPRGVAVDGLGDIYIADTSNNRIRRVDAATGAITTVAGDGTDGADELSAPAGIAVDGLGNLFIADAGNNRIRRVDAATVAILTVAGDGDADFTGDGGAATSAALSDPLDVAVDHAGDLFIADTGNGRVRRVDAMTGVITTIAGTGADDYTGDGGAAISAAFDGVSAVAVDTAGDVFVADTDNNRIRRIDATTGVIATVAGDGVAGGGGDGGAATSAELYGPTGVAVDGSGNLYLADTLNGRIRRVDTATGAIDAVAGDGAVGSAGDGGAATSAELAVPVGVAVDAAGNVYIADAYNHRVRRIDAMTGVISTVAGNGTNGYAGDGGAAIDAEMTTPIALAIDQLGDMFIADYDGHRIRRVDGATGVITTIAGTGSSGYGGDGGAAANAVLSFPSGVALDQAGDVYIADTGNNRIRRIDAASGAITTVAGNGTASYAGDNGAATAAELSSPYGVIVDAAGNVIIADSNNNRIRRVAASTGVISTIAGNGTADYTGDGGPATAATLDAPDAVAVDGHGNLFISDYANDCVRRVDAVTLEITTFAGDGIHGFSGDLGAATSAEMSELQGLTLDARGDVFVTEVGSDSGTFDRVRRIDGVTGVITTIAGPLEPGGMGPLAQARLADPRALAVVPGAAMVMVAGGSTGTVQAISNTTVEVVAGRYPQPSAIGQLARYRGSSFGTVGGVAYDAANGVIYVSESTVNRIHAVTIVDPQNADTWTIAPLANAAGIAGHADGAVATARFRDPTGLLLDGGTLYVADTGNHVIRAIDLPAGTVRTVIGTPATLGFDGDGGPAAAALLYLPQAIAKCGNGDLFVADTGNDRIRRVDGTGTITTVLGDGIAEPYGDGTPAAMFPIDNPLGVGCDSLGDVYATSHTTVRQLPANAGGVVDGTGPVLTIYGAPPRDTFPANATSCLTGLAVRDDNTVWVLDSCTGLLVSMSRQ